MWEHLTFPEWFNWNMEQRIVWESGSHLSLSGLRLNDASLHCPAPYLAFNLNCSSNRVRHNFQQWINGGLQAHSEMREAPRKEHLVCNLFEWRCVIHRVLLSIQKHSWRLLCTRQYGQCTLRLVHSQRSKRETLIPWTISATRLAEGSLKRQKTIQSRDRSNRIPLVTTCCYFMFRSHLTANIS